MTLIVVNLLLMNFCLLAAAGAAFWNPATVKVRGKS